MKTIFKNINMLTIIEYAVLIAGCFVISLSFNLFLCPNNIASGGIPGLSVVLKQLIGINTAYIQGGLNLSLFFVGILTRGISFSIKTIIGSITIPMFVLLTQNIPAISHNLLLASVLGGIGVGSGLALIFKSKGSAGGFSLVAQILHDYTKVKHSRLIVILNAVVILAAGFTFGFSGAFYAFISLIITGVSIDASNFIFNFLHKNKHLLKTKELKNDC